MVRDTMGRLRAIDMCARLQSRRAGAAMNTRPVYLDDDDAVLPVSAPPSNEEPCDRPNANSVAIFGFVDKLNCGMRALVHEYGAQIIASMWQEGYTNARELRPWMEVWRKRRQDAILEADHKLTRKGWLMAIRSSNRRKRQSTRSIEEAVQAAEERARGGANA